MIFLENTFIKNAEDVLILAIESSCDETAAAVVKNGRDVLSNIINSQIDIHKRYGGVVPEIASRCHIEAIDAVIDEALCEAGVTLDDIDAVAVTYGPGLVGALLVGVSEAKAIAFAKKKPLIAVHHIKGHISANFIAHKELEPPFMCLVASGGHSHIVHVKGYREFEVIARTCDDAAGEAYDKVARVLGLGYPGGPKIDALAKQGDENAVHFPRVKIGDGLDFSFSGVKTAVINYLHKLEQNGQEYNKADIAASFQAAVVEALCSHTMCAACERGVSKVALAGGVAANSALRSAFAKACEGNGFEFYVPPMKLCTDNAAMIGCCAYYKYLDGDFAGDDLNAAASLELA